MTRILRKWTVVDLERTQISPIPEGDEAIPYVGSQRRVRAQSSCGEVPRNEPSSGVLIGGSRRLDEIPDPRQQSQPHRSACHTQWSQKSHPSLMMIVDAHAILNVVPCIATGEMGVWGDMGEDGKDELVRELENCENGMRYVSVRSKEVGRRSPY